MDSNRKNYFWVKNRNAEFLAFSSQSCPEVKFLIDCTASTEKLANTKEEHL